MRAGRPPPHLLARDGCRTGVRHHTGPAPEGDLEDPGRRTEYGSRPLFGESWLRVVREQPRSGSIQLARSVLDPVYEAADPPIVRLPANDHAIIDARNARLIEDNARFNAFVKAPFRAVAKPRLRPELRFGELLELWKDNAEAAPAELSGSGGGRSRSRGLRR